MTRAAARDVFFTPGAPRITILFQRAAGGRVIGYISRREGRDLIFNKIWGRSRSWGGRLWDALDSKFLKVRHVYNPSAGRPKLNRASDGECAKGRGGFAVRFRIFAIALLCTSLCASALGAIMPCEDLKAEIAKKLDAKGATGYTLSIADKGKEPEGKVVGTCGGGKQSIVYQKTRPAAEAKATTAKKPK